MDRRHLVFEQDFDAAFFRGLDQRIHQAGADRVGPSLLRGHGFSGVRNRPVERHRMHLARDGVADRDAAALVRRLVRERHAVFKEPVVSGHIVVGEGAHDLAVVVAIVRRSVGLYNRPVGQVAEQQVRRILDAVFLLRRGAAAEWHVAAAADRVAAHMRLDFNQDDGCAGFPRGNRCRNAGCAGPNDHDVCFVIPLHGDCFPQGDHPARLAARVRPVPGGC